MLTSTLTVTTASRMRASIPLLAVFMVVTVVVACYWQTAASLIGQWSLGAYQQGWLVAILSGLLLLRERRAIAAAPARPELAAAIGLALTSAVWAIVFNGSIQVGHQLLLPMIAFLAVAAFLGWQIARACAFAIGFTYFAVPLWSVLVPWLQALAVAVVGRLLWLSSIPMSVSGDIIYVRGGGLEIADECSGLNYLVVTLAIATLYGELLKADWRVRLRLVALGTGLALLGNWFRIYCVVFAGASSGMKSPLVHSHVYFGWWVFAGVLLVFFLVARGIRSTPQGGVAVVTSKAINQRTNATTIGTVAALAALVLGPVLVAIASYSPVAGNPPRVAPATVPGWVSLGPVTSDWRPLFRAADALELTAYRNGDGTVEMFTASYLSQRQGHKLFSSDNFIGGDPQETAIVESNAIVRPRAFNELVIEDSHHQRWVLWYDYVVSGHQFASGSIQALYYGLTSLRARPIASVVSVRTRCSENDCTRARNLLSGFWPTIQDWSAGRSQSRRL